MRTGSKHLVDIQWRISLLALFLLSTTIAYSEEFNQRTITDISTSLQDNGSMLISWSPVPNAAGYKIYHSDQPYPENASDWVLLNRVTTTGYTVPMTSDHGFYRVASYSLPPNATGFALVEGGTFNNGVSDVTITTFYMSNHEVTQGEYQALTGTNPSTHFPFNGIGADFPVWDVQWSDAINYCNLRSIQEGLTPCYSLASYGTNPANWPKDWIRGTSQLRSNIVCDWTAGGYRLPTEIEWQFAAQGGNYTHNYVYSGSNNIDDVGWYYQNWSCVFMGPHTVNGLAPNELGIYDMSGNIWEWVWDACGDYPDYPQTDPHGPEQDWIGARGCRGGAWNVSQPYPQCSVTFRYWADSSESEFPYNGFRVCIAP